MGRVIFPRVSITRFHIARPPVPHALARALSSSRLAVPTPVAHSVRTMRLKEAARVQLRWDTIHASRSGNMQESEMHEATEGKDIQTGRKREAIQMKRDSERGEGPEQGGLKGENRKRGRLRTHVKNANARPLG